uniref:Uncharacterized protein n=1 Tax=Ficus carica TaxID=3494 RepID=A0AA88CN51_FICCA|nr:hypothetical protein TIFTF001_050238 [Ficus carica]GMN22977.1 hypothetical protein TIFTF001_050244 [Ficus carica]
MRVCLDDRKDGGGGAEAKIATEERQDAAKIRTVERCRRRAQTSGIAMETSREIGAPIAAAPSRRSLITDEARNATLQLRSCLRKRSGRRSHRRGTLVQPERHSGGGKTRRWSSDRPVGVRRRSSYCALRLVAAPIAVGPRPDRGILTKLLSAREPWSRGARNSAAIEP